MNYISDFIYIRPTGTFDPTSGFEIFEHVQGDAMLTGFELSVRSHPASWLELSGAADYVYGQNRDTDAPLPAMPPFRVTGTLRFEPRASGRLARPYLSLTGVLATAHPSTRLDPNEFATRPYQLAHIGAGGELFFGGRSLALDLTVQNVFDREYRDFLSRYKRYAAEMGRNAVLRATVSF